MNVTVKQLSVVSITTPGTPVPVTADDTLAFDVIIQADMKNKGIISVGDSGLAAGTGISLLPGEFVPFSGSVLKGTNISMFLKDFYVDGNLPGDKVRVVYSTQK